ncbi:MAG: type IV secretion protein Rhs [marine bacterium B5-7]|nr:MAG: type IV secretion protein Rhs [marine bacterium B5-7]
MNDERIIPAAGEASTVTYSLLVDGSELPQTVEVLSIVTEREANRVPRACLVIRDGDIAAEDFPISNEEYFVPGKELEIKAGHASQEKTIFKGIIIKHGIKVRGRGDSSLRVDCWDAAVKMTVGRKSRFFIDKKDSDVFADILGEYGLTADIAATGSKHSELVQYYATDWDFVLSRADANGLLVIVDDGVVAVQPPKLDGAAELSILLGGTIYEFDAQIDARHQFQSVRAHGWDYSSQHVTTKDGIAPSPSPIGNLSESDLAKAIGLEKLELRHTGRLDDQELKAWADSQLVRSSLAKIIGRAQVPGFPDVKPGQLVGISGVGDRFNGKAYITAVRQEIVGGAWRTEIQFGLSPERFACRESIVDVAAAGLVPALHGLHIGIATALEGDPDGEDRIQVQIPLIDAEGDGIWARWLCPYAGADRGVFFRPEIGAELIVGFLNKDPRDPIVLGMVHSSQKPAPIQLSNDNHEKAIVTREGMRVHFDDDKKVVTIDTPGGNSVVLSDDGQSITLTDQHSNSMTMNSDGITLDASKITLKSQQEIKIEAGTDFKVKSGANAEIKAGAQLKVDGGAGADLTTSAIATIKGSLVKIN